MRSKHRNARSMGMDPGSCRRLWPLTVSASLLVVARGLFCASRTTRAPLYEDKTLVLWLRTYAPSSKAQRNSPEWKKGDDAVRQRGTNCIPVLLRMLRAKDSVPALMRMYNENVSTESQRAILDALAWIGPSARPAIPLLLGAATNSDARIRANALWALGEIHAEPELCVPKLIDSLNDSNAWTRLSAAHALGMFGADAQAAIVPLNRLTNAGIQAPGTPDIQVSIESRNALRKIRPQVEGLYGTELLTTNSPFFSQ